MNIGDEGTYEELFLKEIRSRSGSQVSTQVGSKSMFDEDTKQSLNLRILHNRKIFVDNDLMMQESGSKKNREGAKKGRKNGKKVRVGFKRLQIDKM